MAGAKVDRQRLRRRQALERAMDAVASGALPPWAPELLDQPGLASRAFADPESLFFHDHGEWVAGLGEAMERQGLAEACLAMARAMEEDRGHWLRRLALVEAEPRLRARRALLELDYLTLFSAHFRRWGAAGVQGERVAEFEAASLLGAIQGAQRLWLRGAGSPILPVLMNEALAVLWPALYGHARRYS
jgi:hypothetical protein